MEAGDTVLKPIAGRQKTKLVLKLVNETEPPQTPKSIKARMRELGYDPEVGTEVKRILAL